VQDEAAVEQDTGSSPVSDRVLHSDPHDFAGLYIRHRASFTLHARRYLRDGRDADEVVQEAFLRLFLALPELETELQALAYCRRTITNLCIDRFRAQARRPSLVDLDSAGAMDLAESDPGDPVVRAEDAAMVRAALSLLSPLHRAALVKREIEEKTLPVIAEELEIPEESVKHVLFRARRALRRILASTSLAPGSDAELAGALGRAARAGSGGLVAFVMLLVVGLGTGPDLRAIPVVGTDLPDLISVSELAKAVGTVVTDVAGAVTSTGDSAPTTEEAVGAADGGDPLPAPGPSRSPASERDEAQVVTTTPSDVPAPELEPESELETKAAPSPTAAAPKETAGTTGSSPSASPSASPAGSESPSPSPSPAPAGSPSPQMSPEPEPKPAESPKDEGPDRRPAERPSPSPSPESEPSPG
jgi:RNA polymerase sigma factor (sigma-70 family)